MNSRLVLITVVFMVGGCKNTPTPKWLLGNWEIAVSKETVEITEDSLIFYTDERSSLFYRYKHSDSTLVLKIPDSDDTYRHDLNVKIKEVSSNKDTIWFIESDFETNTFAVKQ